MNFIVPHPICAKKNLLPYNNAKLDITGNTAHTRITVMLEMAFLSRQAEQVSRSHSGLSL
jgi:hypothetical protein